MHENACFYFSHRKYLKMHIISTNMSIKQSQMYLFTDHFLGCDVLQTKDFKIINNSV